LGGLLGTLTVGHLGTKAQLSISAFICCLSMLFLGLFIHFIPTEELVGEWKAWLPVVLISIFVISFGAGPGPLPYSLIGECFASKL